ncbi:hypothetical protein [Halalkalibacter sp. APA_J-10(15)]|uniref:hypothetical protein n=1 Tax=Halalkalibacter sp. APA_J-10(15) TaxID=2933805 RepID=UPI001FF50D38|nr:hypothetical protein [Halalkalibacter sp. APA_J-10(15)]MCK0470877.1 hypothetical protein [Halalkalibacter sp. APA_J-10(15)]
MEMKTYKARISLDSKKFDELMERLDNINKGFRLVIDNSPQNEELLNELVDVFNRYIEEMHKYIGSEFVKEAVSTSELEICKD